MAYAHKFKRQDARRNVHRAVMEEESLPDARHEEEMRWGERKQRSEPGRARKRRVEAFYGRPRGQSEAQRNRRLYKYRGPGAGRYAGHEAHERATGQRPYDYERDAPGFYDYEKHRRHNWGGRRRKSKKVRRKKTKRRRTRHKRRRRSRRTRRRRR